MIMGVDSSFDFFVDFTKTVIASFVSGVALLNNDYSTTVRVYEQFLISIKEYEPEKQSKYSSELLKDYLNFVMFEL